MFALLATLFTGIGGHFINRRWDRALLFFCLFLVYLLVVYGISFFAFSRIQPGDDIAQLIEKRLHLIMLILGAGIVTLWGLSLIVTLVDRRSSATFVDWTKSGIAAALISSCLSCLIVVYSSYTTVVSLDRKSRVDKVHAEFEGPESHSEFEPSVHESDMFYQFLYLGGAPSSFQGLPEPPSGEGILRGRIMYNHSPVPGVSLNLALNSSYYTPTVTTDSNGVFTIPLPQGVWYINAVKTQSWLNKPQLESVSLYYGGEEKLSEGSYHSYFNVNSKGYPCTVSPKKPDQPHIDITIKPDIVIMWPNSSDKGVKTSIDNTIHWQEYPQAHVYLLEIDKVERLGNTTRFTPVISRRITGRTSQPLKSLPHSSGTPSEPVEYSVRLHAFSQDGTLLGKSDTFSRHCFLLTDGARMIQDRYSTFIDQDPDQTQASMDAISLNEERASAVTVLIQEDMIPEAMELISRMDSAYSLGQKESLLGYAHSIQGNCEKARLMFDKARAANPDVCIPTSYYGPCGE